MPLNLFSEGADYMGNYAIETLDISKEYKGFDFDRKENGIGLWVKNILKLTSNKVLIQVFCLTLL
jgi:hypothetical protein